MESTFEKIRGFLAEQLGVDAGQITMDSDLLNDFEADSLDIVDMVMTLEDEFGIEVPDDAIENLHTVAGAFSTAGRAPRPRGPR